VYRAEKEGARTPFATNREAILARAVKQHWRGLITDLCALSPEEMVGLLSKLPEERKE